MRAWAGESLGIDSLLLIKREVFCGGPKVGAARDRCGCLLGCNWTFRFMGQTADEAVASFDFGLSATVFFLE